MSASRVANRLNILRRHMSAVALNENVIFPKPVTKCAKVLPVERWGYSMQINVSHDEKIINIVTDSMSHTEKRLVFLEHKKMLRDEYPHYIITEKHN